MLSESTTTRLLRWTLYTDICSQLFNYRSCRIKRTLNVGQFYFYANINTLYFLAYSFNIPQLNMRSCWTLTTSASGRRTLTRWPPSWRYCDCFHLIECVSIGDKYIVLKENHHCSGRQAPVFLIFHLNSLTFLCTIFLGVYHHICLPVAVAQW
jgi:hypothetical protein